MTQRRQVGFIRTFSSKNIQFQEEPSQFSYFKLKGTRDDDQFSPYKFQDNQTKPKISTLPAKRLPAKPPLPERKTLKDKISTYLHGKAEAEEYYDKIKQRIASYEEKQSSSKQKLQENIGNIRNKIERLDQVLKDLKSSKEHSVEKKQVRPPSAKKNLEKEFKSSSSSSSEEQVVITAIPSPKIVNQSSKLSSKGRVSAQKQASSSKHTQPKEKGVKFLDEDNQEQQSSHKHSENNKSRQRNDSNGNVITFNSRIKNQPPLYIKSYSNSSSSQSQEIEQIQQNKEQMKQIPTRQNEGKHQFFKNKGGVCFEVDVKQFTAPVNTDRRQMERQTKPQKKEKIDKKAQIIRRRETAKAFDKKTRKALFSPQY